MDLGEKISAFSFTMRLPLYSGDAAATGGPGRQGDVLFHQFNACVRYGWLRGAMYDLQRCKRERAIRIE